MFLKSFNLLVYHSPYSKSKITYLSTSKSKKHGMGTEMLWSLLSTFHKIKDNYLRPSLFNIMFKILEKHEFDL